MHNASGFQIAPAAFEDLADIARIHVLSWQQAYRGKIPQAHLDSLDVAVRQKKWEEIFHIGAAENKHLYIAKHRGNAVGFISFGSGRDADKPGQAEIYATYLLMGAWGSGTGYNLFQTAKQILAQESYAKAYLWVLETNKNAIQSYRQWGGTLDQVQKRQETIGGQPLTERLIGFDIPK